MAVPTLRYRLRMPVDGLPPLDAAPVTVLDLWYTKYEEKDRAIPVDVLCNPDSAPDWLDRQMAGIVARCPIDRTSGYTAIDTFPPYVLYLMEFVLRDAVKVHLVLPPTRRYTTPAPLTEIPSCK
jgi:hypothetical protein